MFKMSTTSINLVIKSCYREWIINSLVGVKIHTDEEYDLRFLLQTQNQHVRKAILNQSTRSARNLVSRARLTLLKLSVLQSATVAGSDVCGSPFERNRTQHHPTVNEMFSELRTRSKIFSQT